VAAKDAVHYDPRRVRASVTGQTTVAASSATTSRPKGRIVTAFFATVAIEVRLATPLWESDRNSLPRRLAVTSFADYAILQPFVCTVASLAAGATDDTVHTSDIFSA
jgi:hypothetical protein